MDTNDLNNNGVNSNDDNSELNNKVWDSFVDDLNGAQGLTWDVNEPAQLVDFMDLTITIANGRVSTMLFEKRSNRHLYIPAHLSHPPGVVNGIIHGMFCRIYSLCSN